MRAALVGNQNCGKTTLFNALTGLTARTGNFPGVTVEVKTGRAGDMEIVDLPGVYSLNTFSPEEKLCAEYLLSRQADVVVNVVDASNIERNLYLTLQLLQTGVPVVVALNMMDEVKKAGTKIEIERLSAALGVPVCPVSAKKGEGLTALLTAAKSAQRSVVPECIRRLSAISDPAVKAQESYAVIDGLLKFVHVGNKSRLTERIDRVLLNKFFAYPFFILIIALVFFLTFQFSAPITGALNSFFEYVRLSVLSLPVPEVFASFAVAILDGVFSVGAFLPMMAMLFLLLSILEDSGYMARAALIFDAPLSKAGLSGASVIPLMLGFGCNVPAILATRVIASKEQREKTVIAAPYMMCGAKLPVFVTMTAVFFSRISLTVILSLYLIGAALGLAAASLFRAKKNEKKHFLYELPPYRMPSAKSVAKLVGMKLKGFLKRIFFVMLTVSVIIWFLKTFNFAFQAVDVEESMLAYSAKTFAVLFSPMSIPWQAVAALICGMAAKEAALSALGVTIGLSSISAAFSPAGAVAFLIFFALYSPCAASLSAMRGEIGGKKTAVAVLLHFVFAWGTSFLAYTILSIV